MSSEKWVAVEDHNVRHVWKNVCDENNACDEDCEGYDGEEITVGPQFYEESGEPNCPVCGRVYRYLRTEIKKTETGAVVYNWWPAENPKSEISEEHKEELKEAALQRIGEAVPEGYTQGQLTAILHDKETEEELEFTGWWTVE